MSGTERWRVITPIALSALSILAGINAFLINDFKKTLDHVDGEQSRQLERVHQLEMWREKTEATRFKMADWNERVPVLVQEILEQVALRYPPRDLIQRIDRIEADVSWIRKEITKETM